MKNKTFDISQLAFYNNHLVAITSDKPHTRNRVTIKHMNKTLTERVTSTKLVSMQTAGEILKEFYYKK